MRVFNFFDGLLRVLCLVVIPAWLVFCWNPSHPENHAGKVSAQERAKGRVVIEENSITARSGDGKSKLSVVAGEDYVGLWLTKDGRSFCLYSGHSFDPDVGPYFGVIRERGGVPCEWSVSINKEGTTIQTVGKAGKGEVKIEEVK